MPHPGKTYHLLAELLSTLQAEGYPLGTGQQLQVQELWNKLPADTPIEEIPFLLAPLFASSPKEQAHFYELFEQCRRRTEAFYREVEEEQSAQPDHQERRFRWAIWALVLLLLVPPVVVLYQLMKPDKRDFIEKPFQVQAGEKATACLTDTTDLKEFGTPDHYKVIYAGRGGLGAFLIDTPQCLTYIAQDSVEGRDSIVVEWSNAEGNKLVAHYLAIIVVPEPEPEPDDTVPADTPREEPIVDTPPLTYAFDFQSYPFNHDPLVFAVQPPTWTRQFLADNFWWLKWGGLLLFTTLLLALLFYRAYRRRKLVAELEAKDNPPYAWNIHIEGAEAIHLGDDFSFILNLIRQRTGSEAFKLDVPRTIGATIEQGGMPTFRFLQQTQPPEYLLMIEQQSGRNHRARLLDLLFQIFHANEVLIERFFYDSDLRVCYNEVYPEGIPIQEIQQRYASSRLIVAGHGNALLNKLSGKLEPWSKLIRNWKHRLLLTPRPTQSWGKRERRLGELFTLLPLSMQSLHFWLEELEMEEDARFDTWPSRVTDAPKEAIELNGALAPSLQAHFSEPMLQWIAACAVYPSLHWDLTLYLGQQLSIGKENLLTVNHLLQLTRLPWFTEGRIPPAARISLLDWLQASHPALLEQVRTQLAEILQQNPPPQDSAAFEDYRMNVALNEWLTTKNKRHKKELEQEIGRLMEAGADADVTVIKQLQRKRSPLDFIIPDSWKKYLHPHGLPGLGWRGEWRDVLRWALPLWLPALLITAWPWQITLTKCGGPLVDYHLEGENYLLCLNETPALAVMLEEHAKAAVASDSLAAATLLQQNISKWMAGSAPEVQLPFSVYSAEADWDWRIGQLKNWGGAKVEASKGFFTLPSPADTAIATSWQAEYRSNMAVAFYNKGVELYLSSSQFFDQSPAAREAQLRDGLAEWKKIKTGASELPADVQQSMLSTFERLGLRDTSQLSSGAEAVDSLINRFEQLISAGRGRVCAYFQEAIRLDSSQLDMRQIRSWCTADSAPDTIPSEACFVISNVPNEIALRSRQLTRQEADELNANYGKGPEWDQLRVNRETLIKSIRPGEQVQLLEELPEFYHIRHKGVNGFIVKTYQSKPTLEPCFNQPITDSTRATPKSSVSPESQKLEKIMVQAATDWNSLKRKADLSWDASGTTFPEIGVRGRYAILKPLLNPAILEKLFGEKVYRSGPHRGANIDYRNEAAFGRYNPAFLKKLSPTLNSLSKNKLLAKQVQGLYNREFRDIMRVFYLAYPVAANQKDIQDEFLSILNTPIEKRDRYAINYFFNQQFRDFANEMAKEGYDALEGNMAAQFWVRRSIDGTAREFYQLLQLSLRTFDPAFLASAAQRNGLRISSELLKLDPTQQISKNDNPNPISPSIQQIAPESHTPRYLWCLDNALGMDTRGYRSPIFDDGKTQLFEYKINRDIVERIIRKLEEIGVAYYQVVPEEEDISLQQRARRINEYQSSLPKLAVSMNINAGPSKDPEAWAGDGARGIEAWYFQNSQASQRLGAVFLEKAIKKTGLINRFVKAPPGSPYYLLSNISAPAIMIENGFLNNRSDAALLAQPAFLQKLADAYVEAILAIEANGLESTPAPLIDQRDSDGDGIENSVDFCPFSPGPADNNGCPLEDIPPQTLLKSKN